jgi:hypothetical protein
LSRVLALTDPADVRGGSVATGLDLWAAATLRQAGLSGVRPYQAEPFFVGTVARMTQPFFERIDDAVRGLAALDGQLGQLPAHEARQLRQSLRQLVGHLRGLRAEVERSTTAVLGESRRKQVNVFLAEWDRGLELLISTKTFALAVDTKELVKNLPNRWEEFDGDLKNLRGRFSLAVIGALTVLPAVAMRGALPAFVDMMTKLTAPGRPWVNAHDRATIIVADWDARTDDVVPIINDSVDESQLPAELQPVQFFDALLERLFQRAPVTEHAQARVAARQARGEEVESLTEAAAAVEQAENVQGEQA